MLGADTFVSAILRVVTTVAVLAAVYFFIVKPVLQTTETVSHSINFNTGRAIRSANRAIRESGVQTRHKVTVQVHRAVHGNANLGALPKQAQRILRCIDRAHGDVNKIQACNRP
jgi:hypothetical protein